MPLHRSHAPTPFEIAIECFTIAMAMLLPAANSPAGETHKDSVPRSTAKAGSPDLPSVVLRRPTLPTGDSRFGLTNPVDRILRADPQCTGLDLGRTVSDAVFMRRVSLDLIGLLPSPAQLDSFAADVKTGKRDALVRRLLNQREDYAIHWLAYWNDLLRNEYRGTGFIDDGRRQITEWLFRALYENKPYDRFVRELISPVAGSEGFIKGIEWRGVVNASQRKEMQAAQTTAQVFLGTNLKCASCHDSFINHWTLDESHSLAAAFAPGPYDVFRCDKATGHKAKAAFLFPEVGEIESNAPRSVRLQQLAALMTDARNGRFPRTIVNRLWARLLGRGLIEPLDDMEQTPFSADLLDWLAADLVDHKFDLKHTLEVICTSHAYQLPAVDAAEADAKTRPFRGPLVRRMTAEQFVDAVATVTGAWPKPTGDLLKKDGRGQGGQVGAVRAVLAADKTARHRPAERIRAGLAMEDPLSRALGRPNREQVVTRRDSQPTMLQALELTNGKTLDELLKQGAREWASAGESDPRMLVERAYRSALGRRPNDAELKTLVEVVGSPPSADGIQDLLWMTLMLPEFQLIF